MKQPVDERAPAYRTWAGRVLWLLALWVGGVAAIAIITAVLKWIMRAAGLAV